jgi:signal transduction histidine kinase
MGMKQRIKALGGRFELQSTPGAGTKLYVEVPKRVAA